MPANAPPRPLALLVYAPGAPRPRVFDLTGEVVLGRAGDLRLDDPRVSRHHCRIYPAGDIWVVEDLGSQNGTLLDRRLLGAPAPIAPGDELRVGPYRILPVEPEEARRYREPQVRVHLGSESIVLPVKGRVPLVEALSVGGRELPGAAVWLVERPEGDVWLEPDPGAAPVVVRGEPVTEPVPLGERATLRLGATVVEVELV